MNNESCCLVKCINSTCNIITLVLEYMFIPFKYILYFPLKFFERQYSFMMLINFILLIIPFMLMITLLSHWTSEISSDSFPFRLIFFTNFIICIINYYLTYYIYEKYNIHKLNRVKKSFTAKSFMSYLCSYMFKEHKIGYLIIFLLVQIPYLSISLYYFISNKQSFKVPEVVYTITLYSSISVSFFLFCHLFIYLLLLITLLCKVSNSEIKFNSKDEMKNKEVKTPSSTPQDNNNFQKQEDQKKIYHNKVNSNAMLVNDPKTLSERKSHEIELKQSADGDENSKIILIPFIERLIDCFKYIKIFDYNKEFGEGERILDEIK